MRKATLVIFRRRLGWYWHLRAANGRIQSAGVEPFSSPASARRGYERSCTVQYTVRVEKK